VEENMLLNI